MIKKIQITLLAGISFLGFLFAQNTTKEFCASSLLVRNAQPENKARIASQNAQWAQDYPSFSQRMLTQYTLPVVVHIVHYPATPLGTNENISNSTAQDAINWLNQAFANTGYYDPATGVDTEIQFCLAQQDPSGAATSGIEHIPSALSNMVMENDDISVKDLSRWNPNCYINIWVVDEICSSSMGCGVAGYAFFPSSHGSPEDGIVIEANYFGSSLANNTVLAHEMGHYLGLYHTFEGGCTNNNCLTDGDLLCDTPPDQSTTWISCSTTANTCSTDAQSGFSSDVNDMTDNYMDYNDVACYTAFTNDQRLRMQWHIANVRSSLLACSSCMSPCPNPFIAGFTTPTINVSVGDNVVFTNTSTGGNAYTWQINGVNFASTTNASYTFNSIGTYTITLIATQGAACSYSYEMEIHVTCPVVASFTSTSLSILPGGSVTFSNTSLNANGYEWFLDFSSVATTTNLTQTFPNPGQYQVYLVADNNGLCSAASQIITITVGNDCSQIEAGANQTICAGDTVQLAGYFTNPIPGAIVQWTGGGGTFIPNANSLTPQYVPTQTEIDGGLANLQMQVQFNAPGSSITPRLIGYGHNGNDDIYYLNPTTGVSSIITANFGHDWLAMGYDISTETLYGVSYGSGNNFFYKWDIPTLTHTQITFSAYPMNMTAGDYDNTNDIFYTIGTVWGTNVPQKLYSINTTTGVANYIGDLGLLTSYPGYTAADDGINGIAYDPLLNILYGVSSNDKLFSIDVSTGAATFIGNLSTTGLSFRGLAYDFHTGRLWGESGGAILHEIDKNTGNILTVAPGVSPMPTAGLTYAPNIVGSLTPIICFDSVKISIQPQPEVNLGNDTSFCAPNTLAITPIVNGASSWVWEDGSNLSPRIISSSGLYWVEATNSLGCTSRDSIQINVVPQPNLTLDLGADIHTCHTNVIVLDAGAGFSSYLWYNFSNAQTNTVYGSGTYFVKTSDFCGNIYRDTILINMTPIPATAVNASICAGNTYTLPDGSSVNSAGIYNTTLVSIQGCDSLIETTLAVLQNSTVDLYPNICLGDSYTLPNGNVVSGAGNYPSILTAANGCDSTVFVHLTVLQPSSTDIYPTICQGQSYTLANGQIASTAGTYTTVLSAVNTCDSTIYTHLSISPPPFSSIQITACEADTVWLPNGIPVTTAGTFTSVLSSPNGCDSLVYTYITRTYTNWKTPTPLEFELCIDQPEVELNAQQSFPVKYLWNTGNQNASIFVSEEGSYRVEMSACADTVKYDFHITYCPTLYIPTAFSPNGDGHNDTWGVKGMNINSLSVLIFDRWGNKVSTLNSGLDYWDGLIEGRDAPEGAYTFKLNATLSDGKTLSRTGSITLIR